ncbi:MAG TPA: glycine--tRNA ligase subunit beta [Candidatus Limnocylindrales bacterium]|nr:glycine--tRNA ligase subunit beta [Candidatus Limnocylindrales bacterium]
MSPTSLRQQDLLLELLSEEIPARMQARAAQDLKRLMTEALAARGLPHAQAVAFAGPRRLTLALTGLPAVTPETVEERRGPRVDAPEKALEGFLRSTGLARDDLEAREDRKGKIWFATIRRPGRAAAEVIAEAVPEVIRAFPWPKSMRWGSGSLRWVRPLHAILCLLSDEQGAEVVPFEIDGIASGDTTRGHRFMAPEKIRVTGFEDYAEKLAAAKVMLDPADRAETIAHDAAQAAFAQGLEIVEDKGLMAEVAGLVEWPVTLMGPIEERFLDLPTEVLRTSMKEHQKFFSVRNPATGRIEAFVTVANLEAPDGGRTILAGNARVLAARLADAAFFWQNDLRVVEGRGLDGMAAMAEPLAQVTFHSKLGTQAERIDRISALAREIAPHVGADPNDAEQAARIAKADLASEMVYEFPELQGVMGRYYAARAGLKPEIAAAAEGHYKPLGPSDEIPTEPVTVAVALADKIDLLTGMWAIDEKPTGSKDPFALRRAALGVIRTALGTNSRIALINIFRFALVEHFRISTRREGVLVMFEDDIDYESGDVEDQIITLDAKVMLTKDPDLKIRDGQIGADLYSRDVIEFEAGPRTQVDLLSFLADRLKVHLRDEGIRHDVIQACFELGGQDDLVLLVARVRAVQKFLETPDGEHLLTAYRRANNILRQAKAETPDAEIAAEPDPARFVQPEETALADALARAEAEAAEALGAEDFRAAMEATAKLRAPVDAFFDAVTVNADDAGLRLNRLALLTRIRAVMRRLAVWDAIEG